MKTATAEDRYGFHFMLYNYLGRINEAKNDNKKALTYYEKAIQCASRPPELLAKTYYKIAQIAS